MQGDWFVSFWCHCLIWRLILFESWGLYAARCTKTSCLAVFCICLLTNTNPNANIVELGDQLGTPLTDEFRDWGFWTLLLRFLSLTLFFPCSFAMILCFQMRPWGPLPGKASAPRHPLKFDKLVHIVVEVILVSKSKTHGPESLKDIKWLVAFCIWKCLIPYPY